MTMKNLALYKTSGSMDLGRKKIDVRPYLLTPSGWAFIALASYVIWFLMTSERTVPIFPDQDAYLSYFRYTDWDWLTAYFQQRSLGLTIIPRIITDEIGWRLWIIGVKALGFTPESGIRLTVALANGLIFVALAQLRRPLLGLVLWIVIPPALATIGLFQVRQGFAFGLAMAIAFGFRRPILGLLLASTIHTTAAFPALLLMAARLGGPNNRVAIPVSIVSGAILAGSAQSLFSAFGGRRVNDYAGYEAQFSTNLLVLVLSYTLASILVMMSLKYVRDRRMRAPLRDLSLMHFGLISYLVVAFLFFPFGKDRVFYYVSLFAPFFVQEIRIKNGITLWMTMVLYVMIVADVYVAYQKALYVYFLH